MLCGCIKCTDVRAKDEMKNAAEKGLRGISLMPLGFRYACEICGNKRCPHHSDHELICSGSNEPGQTGSVFI